MTTHETPLPPYDLYRPGLYTASAVALDGLMTLAGNYDLEVWDKFADDEAGIFTAEHDGVLDIPLLGAANQHAYKGRSIRFMLKDDLVQNYRHHDKVALYFDMMGGITLNVSKPITEQPRVWAQLTRDIANKQLICSFNQKGVMPNRRPRRIGPLAVMTNTAVQPVSMEGTEGNRDAWLGRKTVVYGKVLKPDIDPATIDPADRRSWARPAKIFSQEVDAMMQATAYRAHQLHSRKTVSFSGVPH